MIQYLYSRVQNDEHHGYPREYSFDAAAEKWMRTDIPEVGHKVYIFVSYYRDCFLVEFLLETHLEEENGEISRRRIFDMNIGLFTMLLYVYFNTEIPKKFQIVYCTTIPQRKLKLILFLRI